MGCVPGYLGRGIAKGGGPSYANGKIARIQPSTIDYRRDSS